jgi:hypothetical protein
MEENTYKYLSIIGNWLAGIGALCAALVALWLARRSEKIDLMVNVDERLMVGEGNTEHPRYLWIKIVNRGQSNVIINSIGWRVGKKNKKYCLQLLDNSPYSSKLPIELPYGHEATYLVHFFGEAEWLKSFSNDFIGNDIERKLKSLYLQVFTSVGKTIETKVGESLKEALIGTNKTDKTLKHDG